MDGVSICGLRAHRLIVPPLAVTLAAMSACPTVSSLQRQLLFLDSCQNLGAHLSLSPMPQTPTHTCSMPCCTALP